MRTARRLPVVILLLTAAANLLHGHVLSAQTTPQASQGLPGGASSLQETHGDWRVSCARQSGSTSCALSQQQSDKDTRQLVVAVELNARTPDRADGTLILPFGLAVQEPVSLQIDDAAAPGSPLRVKTCLPVGCIVPVVFDAATVTLLRKATLLTVKAATHDGQPVSFKISLSGFSGALDRTASLSK